MTLDLREIIYSCEAAAQQIFREFFRPSPLQELGMICPSNVEETLTLVLTHVVANIYSDSNVLLVVCDSLVPKSKHDCRPNLSVN